MRTSIARLIAVFGLLIGALAFGTAASANNGNGSSFDTTGSPQCFPFSPPIYLCLTEKGEVNTTVSNDGTLHYEANVKGTATLSDNGTTLSSATFTLHEQGNGTQESHLMLKETVTISGQTLCITNRYHYANGQVQFSDFDITPGAC